MKFSLNELMAKVTGLESRAEAAFKAELAELKGLVSGTVTQLTADLATAVASIASLNGDKTNLQAQVADLTGKLSTANAEFLGFNDLLTQACLNGKLLDLKGADGKPLAADAGADVINKAALAVPMADKFKLYQGAVNAAFLKANVPNTTLPTPPAKSVAGPAGGGDVKKMKLTEFRTLNPKGQSDFCAEVRAGRAELIED